MKCSKAHGRAGKATERQLPTTAAGRSGHPGGWSEVVLADRRWRQIQTQFGYGTLIDALDRRSYTTSIAFGPTIGKNIALAYLPHAYAEVGRELQIQYFADVYPVMVEAVGYRALYDAENGKPRS